VDGPPKPWYPTTTLHGVTKDLDLKYHRRENLRSRNEKFNNSLFFT